jgi:tetratricopeptide (TPR) repeat protein
MTEDQLFDAAQAFSEAGDEANAEPLFARAAEMGSVAARYNQGNALQRLGRLDQAREAFRLAVAAGDVDAPLNLGLVLEELNDHAGAEAAYRRAVQVGDPRGRAFLGRLLWVAGDAAAGEEVLRSAVAERDAYAGSELAGLLENSAATPDLEALFRLAASVDEDALTDLGRHLRRVGHLEEAESVLRGETDRGNADAMIALALLLEEDRDDLVGAEEVLRVAVQMGEVHAYNNLALLLERRGAHIEAESLFAQGARAGDPVAQRNHGRLRSQYKRQLNRAWRKRLRAPAADFSVPG